VPDTYTVTITADSQTTTSPQPVVVDQNVVTTTQVSPTYGKQRILYSERAKGKATESIQLAIAFINTS
jgi:hypothetical protein